MNDNFRLVEVDVAEEFIRVNGELKLIEAKGKLFGYFEMEVLLGILQAGIPRAIEMRENYTVEIYLLVAADEKIAQKLVAGYLTLCRPSDFFFNCSDSLGSSLNLIPAHLDTIGKIYQWVDPNRTHYTYRITATDSDKYYYGVSHVKKANATVEDCRNDGYFGSGNSSGLGKFGRWKANHRAKLLKEVLSLHGRKSEAYARELELIGELFKTDPNCLNSIAGGKSQPHAFRKFVLQNCNIHGETLHSNSNCLKCLSSRNYATETCELHGETSFHGGKCQRCESISRKSLKECPTHGLTKHQGNSCYKCMAKGVTLLCRTHGKTKFYGGLCMKCRNGANITTGHCEKHGNVNHIGDKCYLCVSESAVSLKLCPIHGESKHRGRKCFKCRSNKTVVSEKECPTHGLTKHQGETCSKCSRGAVVLKKCSTHGETKHRGDACFKCATAVRISKRQA